MQLQTDQVHVEDPVRRLKRMAVRRGAKRTFVPPRKLGLRTKNF